MTDTTGAAVEFGSFADIGARATAEMNVVLGGKPSGWIWTLAGPGHAKTIAQADRIASQSLHDEREKAATIANGKKWRPREETLDDLRKKNVGFIVERIVGWSPVKIGGADYPFSDENARMLLSTPANIAVLNQALDFIADERSFARA